MCVLADASRGYAREVPAAIMMSARLNQLEAPPRFSR